MAAVLLCSMGCMVGTQPAIHQVSEADLNRWGYALLAQGDKAHALEVFKLSVSLHPESPRAMDGLAEAEDANGHTQEAIADYKRVLVLNPQGEHAAAQLKRLVPDAQPK